MKNKKNKWLLLVFALLGLSFYGVHEYFKGNKDMSVLNEDFHAKADELINEFAVSETLAEKKFTGKIIVVEGKLKETEKDEKGYFTLVIGDPAIASSVRCLMDTLHTNNITGIKKGSTIVLKGLLTGYNADATGLLGSDIELDRCMRLDEK